MKDNSQFKERERWEQEVKQRYPFLLEKLPYFETSKGWNKLLESMFEEIARREHFLSVNKLKEDYEPVQFLQIKEKFGGLRAYHIGGNDSGIKLIVSNAEDLADKTCEDCGAIETVSKRSIKGWFCTLCNTCLESKLHHY